MALATRQADCVNAMLAIEAQGVICPLTAVWNIWMNATTVERVTGYAVSAIAVLELPGRVVTYLFLTRLILNLTRTTQRGRETSHAVALTTRIAGVVTASTHLFAVMISSLRSESILLTNFEYHSESCPSRTRQISQFQDCCIRQGLFYHCDRACSITDPCISEKKGEKRQRL